MSAFELAWDFLKFVFPIVIFFAIAIGGFIALATGLTYLDCKGFQDGTGMATRWSWGCYVQTEAGWVPKDFVFGKAEELRIKEKK